MWSSSVLLLVYDRTQHGIYVKDKVGDFVGDLNVMQYFKSTSHFGFQLVSDPKESLQTRQELNLKIKFFLLFSTRPSPGLLPVLGPLGSGTDTTHKPSPALRL